MKHIKSILTLAIFAAVISFTTSCGGPKYADTDQIKAWIFYKSVDGEILTDTYNEYIDKLKQNSIKGVTIPEASIELWGEQDTYYINPWIYRTMTSIPTTWGIPYWELDQNKILTKYLEEWDYIYGPDRFAPQDNYLDMILRGNKSDRTKSIYNHMECDKYIQSNPEESATLRLATGNGYINYFINKANDYVTVKDWEYDDDSTTKSCTGYYITYEIGDGFYVLTSLIEEDNSTKFEIEILYSGDSMIDLEQTLSLYKD